MKWLLLISIALLKGCFSPLDVCDTESDCFVGEACVSGSCEPFMVAEPTDPPARLFANDVGSLSSLEVDQNGGLHVLLSTSTALTYQFWNGFAWQSEPVVERTFGELRDTRLVVDSDQIWAASTTGLESDRLMIHRRTDAGWVHHDVFDSDSKLVVRDLDVSDETVSVCFVEGDLARATSGIEPLTMYLGRGIVGQMKWVELELEHPGIGCGLVTGLSGLSVAVTDGLSTSSEVTRLGSVTFGEELSSDLQFDESPGLPGHIYAREGFALDLNGRWWMAHANFAIDTGVLTLSRRVEGGWDTQTIDRLDSSRRYIYTSVHPDSQSGFGWVAALSVDAGVTSSRGYVWRITPAGTEKLETPELDDAIAMKAIGAPDGRLFVAYSRPATDGLFLRIFP